MVNNFYIKKQPKRKIPKMRAPTNYVWRMQNGFSFPTLGFTYNQLWDCFCHDCVNRMHKYAPELFEYNEGQIMIVCCN